MLKVECKILQVISSHLAGKNSIDDKMTRCEIILNEKEDLTSQDVRIFINLACKINQSCR